MLDRSKISLPLLEIHPDLVRAPDQFARDHGFPLLDWQPKTSRKTKDGYQRRTAKLSPLADDIVVVWTVRKGDRYFAVYVEFNPGGLLFGHNGIPIDSPRLLCAALSELVAVMKLLLRNTSDADLVVPGVKRGGGSYWSSLEIQVNLHDPSGALFQACANASHSRIRRPAFHVSGESRKLRGTNLIVNIYRKDREMGKLARKFEIETPADILRIEYTLKAAKLAHYFNTDGGNLKSFTLDQLSAVHRQITSELRGVFKPLTSKKPAATAHARFIATLAMRSLATADDLIEDYLAVGGGNRNTRSQLRKQVIALLEQASTTSFEDVFTDQAYVLQPRIRIPELEDKFRNARLSTGTDKRIHEIYGKPRREDLFVPHVSVDDLCPLN